MKYRFLLYNISMKRNITVSKENAYNFIRLICALIVFSYILEKMMEAINDYSKHRIVQNTDVTNKVNS